MALQAPRNAPGAVSSRRSKHEQLLTRDAYRLLLFFGIAVGTMGGFFVPPDALVTAGVLTLLLGTFHCLWYRIDPRTSRSHLRFFVATIFLWACLIIVVRAFVG